jgi:hypothetical protein
LLRAVCTVGGLIAIALLVAACGSGSNGPGVASVGSSTTPAANGSSSTGASKTGALAYSRCIRSHGVPSFPDPNSNGMIQIEGKPGSGLDPNSPQFQAAQQACKSLQPGPSPTQQRQQFAGALKFAHCMRAHGVPSFPDPKPQTGPQTESASQKGPGPGTQGIDPNSPQVKSAMQVCQHYAPGGIAVHQSGGGPS